MTGERQLARLGHTDMHIVRVADQRAMPWKNGGGITYEVAIVPPDAALDAFDWRVSMARVECDGPFSRFAGIDRSLAIMQGDGLRLVVDGEIVELAPRSCPLVFAGEIPVSATLVSGPIIDLNVMTRRGIWRHRLMREPVIDALAVVASAGTTILVVRSGIVRIGDEQLQARDALLLTAGERAEFAADAPAELYRVELAQE